MRHFLIALALLAACGKKPQSPPATTTAAAPDATAETKPESKDVPIVTPKSVDELGLRIFEALREKDVPRLVGYRPSATFLDRLCPEQSPQMRSAYADALARSTAGVENRAAECDAINWNGATLTKVTAGKEGLPFYGCEPISESTLEVVVTLKSGKEVRVQVPNVYYANGGLYLASMPRCPNASPCADTVAHVEGLIQADASAKLKAPLDSEARISAVAWCEGFYDDPTQRERYDCFRQAKSYGALASCPAPVTEVFKMWPSK